MKQLVFILLLLLSTQLFAQSQTIDFGVIQTSTKRYADVRIRNNAEQTIHLVRIEHSPQIVYRVNQEHTKPDSTFTIRIQVNPDTTGHFDHVMRVFLSDSEVPIVMRVVGEVTEMPDYSDLIHQKCPEFEEKEDKTKETEFTIKTVDAVTGEPIANSTVTIISNGELTESWVTGSTGTFRKKMAPGFLYFVVSQNGFETTETGIYVNSDIETIFIPMRKDVASPELKENVRPELVELPVKIPHEQLGDVLSKQIQPKNQHSEAETTFDSYDLADSSLFKPVNVVFVLDLSSSMKMGEKMNLLKFSLNELVSNLRPQDKISFVTYSASAKVYLHPVYCSNKDIILNKIKELKAEGLSSSTRGIKLGYKELDRQMTPDAANMVIIITDGAFNGNSNDYQKIVQKHAADNVIFSVVGIQCHSRDEHNMREVANFGHGRYVPINKLSDAQHNLLQEIRIASFRGIQ